MAETGADAEAAFDFFVDACGAKCDKATAGLAIRAISTWNRAS